MSEAMTDRAAIGWIEQLARKPGFQVTLVSTEHGHWSYQISRYAGPPGYVERVRSGTRFSLADALSAIATALIDLAPDASLPGIPAP